MLKMISSKELDELGRITIPIEARRKLGWNGLDPIECYKNEKGYIVLEKNNINSGAIRRLDRLGRYTIPIEIRKNAIYQIFLENEKILLKGLAADNADDIRHMTNKELAEFIYNERYSAWNSEKDVLEWLNEKIK